MKDKEKKIGDRGVRSKFQMYYPKLRDGMLPVGSWRRSLVKSFISPLKTLNRIKYKIVGRLVFGIENDFKEPFVTGKGNVFILRGWCFHTSRKIEHLYAVVNGSPLPIKNYGFVRKDVFHEYSSILGLDVEGNSLTSGFWVTIPFPAIEVNCRISLRLRAIYDNRKTSECELGELRLTSKSHPLWTEEQAIHSIKPRIKGTLRKAGVDPDVIRLAQDQHIQTHVLWEYWTSKNSVRFNDPDMAKKLLPKSVDESQVTESIWDNSQEQHCKNNFKVYWELLPEVSNYQLKAMTGKENFHYFEYMVEFMKENIGEKNLRGLSIGCQEWDPSPEEILIKQGLFKKIEVLDIAEGLLKKQSKLAIERGITRAEYKIKDCNNLQLEENAYDLIFAFGTVHHIEKLDILFDQINRGLKSNGLFVMREYIGPNRIQFTDKQLSIVNEILSILPEKYRITFDGFIKKSHTNYDLEMLLRTDPSESVNSQGIMPAIKKHLDIIKLDYTGGTILHPLLNGIASSFEKDEDGAAIIKLLIFIEKTLIEKGVLPSDYVFCMAKKKLNTARHRDNAEFNKNCPNLSLL